MTANKAKKGVHGSSNSNSYWRGDEDCHCPADQGQKPQQQQQQQQQGPPPQGNGPPQRGYRSEPQGNGPPPQGPPSTKPLHYAPVQPPPPDGQAVQLQPTAPQPRMSKQASGVSTVNQNWWEGEGEAQPQPQPQPQPKKGAFGDQSELRWCEACGHIGKTYSPAK